jgi:hypothetical protein
MGNSLTSYVVKSTSNFVFFVIFFVKYRNYRPQKALAMKKSRIRAATVMERANRTGSGQ